MMRAYPRGTEFTVVHRRELLAGATAGLFVGGRVPAAPAASCVHLRHVLRRALQRMGRPIDMTCDATESGQLHGLFAELDAKLRQRWLLTDK